MWVDLINDIETTSSIRMTVQYSTGEVKASEVKMI